MGVAMGTIPGGMFQEVQMHVAETGEENGATVDCINGTDGAFSAVTMHVEGVSGDTITFEATIDNTNWIAIQATNLTTGAEATTATADGLYRIIVMGLRKVRARISTGGSGTVYVTALCVV